MEISKERHLPIQSLVNLIKRYKAEGQIITLAFYLHIIVDDYYNDEYLLNLILRKTNDIQDDNMDELINYVKFLLTEIKK